MVFKNRLVSTLGFLVASMLFQPAWAGSWDAHLAKLNAVINCKAGMYGLDGTQWAGLAQLNLAPVEIQYIIAGFQNPGSLFAASPKLMGTKYMTTRADNNLIILKNASNGAVFVKSKQVVTACFFDSKITPASANVAAQNFAEYLKNIGY